MILKLMSEIRPNNCPLCNSRMDVERQPTARYHLACSNKSCILYSGIFASGLTHDEIVNSWNNSFKDEV